MRTLGIDECAEFLKIERTHALKLAGNRTLPGAKIGRAWVFLEDELVEYLRAEVRNQMRERQVRADVEGELAASAARTQAMTILAPRLAARRESKRKRFDLSGYNDDGTPKLLSER